MNRAWYLCLGKQSYLTLNGLAWLKAFFAQGFDDAEERNGLNGRRSGSISSKFEKGS